MPPALLDRARIQAVVDAIGERLDGEWLLVGGALVALWLEPRRTTEDVDVFGLQGTAEERYALMDLAGALGLPIEAVNSAADFFVRQIDGWRDELEVFRTTERSTVYRPTVTLFVLLKMRRLSEQDLEDCLLALARARDDGSRVDRLRLRASLAALPSPPDASVARRREQLGEALAR